MTSEELTEIRAEVREFIDLAYENPPPTWALRDVAVPLVLRIEAALQAEVLAALAKPGVP